MEAQGISCKVCPWSQEHRCQPANKHGRHCKRDVRGKLTVIGSRFVKHPKFADQSSRSVLKELLLPLLVQTCTTHRVSSTMSASIVDKSDQDKHTAAPWLEWTRPYPSRVNGWTLRWPACCWQGDIITFVQQARALLLAEVLIRSVVVEVAAAQHAGVVWHKQLYLATQKVSEWVPQHHSSPKVQETEGQNRDIKLVVSHAYPPQNEYQIVRGAQNDCPAGLPHGS